MGRFLGNGRSGDGSTDAADGQIVSWRAAVPAFNAGERVLWKCAAGRQDANGVWLAAGDLYVTQDRLILQPPRWAPASRRNTVSYALDDCRSFGRGDLRRIGRYPSWGSNAWKRMRLELANGATIGIAVRRPKMAADVISRAIEGAHSGD